MNLKKLPDKTLIFGSPADIENHFVEDMTSFKSERPLTPVSVVVRSNLQGIYLRRRIAAETGGICNFNFLTITDLAKSFSPSEDGETVSAEDLALIARAALLAQPDDSYFTDG